MNDKTRKTPTVDLLRSYSRAGERDNALKKGRAVTPDRAPAATEATGPELVVFAGLDEWGCGAMAAAWFPMLADPRKARAVVAGGRLPARLHSQVAATMRELDADLDSVHTTALTTDLLREADLVVTMAGTFTRELLMTRSKIEIHVPVHREHWLVSPEAAQFDGVDVSDVGLRTRCLRDLIRTRVAMLVFTEGWGRADLSREMARVTRQRWHSFASI